jgi:hypothetical protein
LEFAFIQGAAPSYSMAKVLGESGRYVSNQVVAKWQKIWLLTVLCIAVVSTIEGMSLGRWLMPAKLSSGVGISIMLILPVVMFWLYKSSSKKMEKLHKERMTMMRGAAGEIAVGFILDGFPDDYCVINDLTTPLGNLDHVVVGPTGVFVIDTKNWRGVVSADGKGELLLNGNPTDKPCIRPFVARMMSVREKVMLLAPCGEVFYEGIFVFTSAIVDAKWGTTGKVKCMGDDQIHKHIVQKNFGDKLEAKEVERVAQAFLALAHMDADFRSGSQAPSNSKVVPGAKAPPANK